MSLLTGPFGSRRRTVVGGVPAIPASPEWSIQSFTATGSGTSAFTLGWRFTPNVDMEVTGLRINSAGSKNGVDLRLYRDGGALLREVIVNAVGGSWVEAAVAAQPLTSGLAYVVCMYGYPMTYRQVEAPPGFHPDFDVSSVTGAYVSGDGRPSTFPGTTIYGLVDLLFTPV